ncbi:MAG: 30S ribosomal protein S16 [Planctomycetaceae bacterium]|nr:30S ribosomal protein S16 [Planctomycetaceae bacterium]
MAVRIRLKRIGRTHRPFYRICVMDSRVHREGKAIEEIGWYDTSVPDKSKRVNVQLDRVDYWVSVGASLSDRVANLVKKVKTNKWTKGGAPAPAQAPKIPEPPAEEAAATEAPAESAEAAPAESEG